MFNAQKPNLEELPTAAQLRRSTLIAAATAGVILITVVLPAEYGIDPTQIGRLLGLTEMGEIKTQLEEEAEADRKLEAAQGQESGLMRDLFGLFVGSATAQEADLWRDEIQFVLAPGDTAEWKLVMSPGQTAQYEMIVTGGRVNFDLHGHGSGQSETYERGRGSTGDTGEIAPTFAGEHGWFWRNRDKASVAVTLRVSGDYEVLKEAP